MDAAGGRPPARWGTASFLMLAALAMSVANVLPLVLAPLAALLLAVPPRRWQLLLLGLLTATAVAVGASASGDLTFAWPLLVAAAFLVLTLARPAWSFIARAMTTVVASLAAAVLYLLASSRWAALDEGLRQHFQEVTRATLEQLRAGAPDSPWTAQFATVVESVAKLQWTLFPAMLALQTLAALGVAWWIFCRMRRPEERWSELRPLREFRFNDQLVWLLIAGIALLLTPLGAAATRAGWNALFFMGGLYVLRGLAIFLFLLAGAPLFISLALGVFAALFLYPLVLMAAFIIGLGDTWLDVRGRAALAARP